MDTFIILSLINIIISLGTLIIYLIGIIFSINGYYQIYFITGLKVSNINSIIKYSSINLNGLKTGLILGKWFIGFIDNEKKLYILMSTNQYNIIFNCDLNENSLITFWERDGNYYNKYYNDKKIKPTTYIATKEQNVIINKIIKFYNNNENNSCVTLITGPPETGKSFVALQLCKKLILDGALTVHLIDTHIPSDPGDTFSALYSRIEPSKDSPLVLVLEEIDILIDNIILNNIISHKIVSILIKNKKGWNQYFDRFNRGIYPYVYIIMTSNKDKQWFEQQCNSLIRNGRVDLIETLNIKINKN